MHRLYMPLHIPLLLVAPVTHRTSIQPQIEMHRIDVTFQMVLAPECLPTIIAHLREMRPIVDPNVPAELVLAIEVLPADRTVELLLALLRHMLQLVAPKLAPVGKFCTAEVTEVVSDGGVTADQVELDVVGFRRCPPAHIAHPHGVLCGGQLLQHLQIWKT